MGLIFGSNNNPQPVGSGGFRISPRVIIGLVIAVVSVIGYFSHTQFNSVTGRKQHISLSTSEEVSLGLQSAPQMAAEFGGLSNDARSTQAVEAMGALLVRSLANRDDPYQFEYHLLADEKTVNAFALPGGQIFITKALFDKLETPGQLAGVLGHETGHVLARHSAEQIAKAQLTQGLVTSGAIAASDRNGGYSTAAIANFVGQFVLLKYSRNHELEADKLGVRFIAAAGFDPRSMIDVMHVLEKASAGRGHAPDFMATHPNPGNRIEAIEEAIATQFPKGLPAGLKK